MVREERKEKGKHRNRTTMIFIKSSLLSTGNRITTERRKANYNARSEKGEKKHVSK
jgi:hypothetical protein